MIGSDFLGLALAFASIAICTCVILDAPGIVDTYHRFRDWHAGRRELKRIRRLWVRYAIIAAELQEMRR